jgi:peptidyl-prolyl cis-trans isomerase C
MSDSVRVALLSAVVGIAIGAGGGYLVWKGPAAAPSVTASVAPGAAAPAAADAAKPAADDPVVARVNGQEIRRTDIMAALQALGPQYQQVPIQAIYPALLEQVVNARLVAGEGYRQNLQSVSDVTQRVKAAEERFVQEAWLRKTIDAKLTDELLKQRYDAFVKEAPAQEEVRARHILVKTKAEADALLKQIKGGADFAKLASEQKLDTASAAQQGDLGFFTKDQMVAPFAEAAFAMKPGEVSKTPVETQFGFHVIKVEERRAATPPTFEQASPELRSQIAQEIAGEAVDALRKSATIETFNIDGTPKAPEVPPAAPADAPAATPADAKPAEAKPAEAKPEGQK